MFSSVSKVNNCVSPYQLSYGKKNHMKVELFIIKELWVSPIYDAPS
jgi:hypothetical protein